MSAVLVFCHPWCTSVNGTKDSVLIPEKSPDFRSEPDIRFCRFDIVASLGFGSGITSTLGTGGVHLGNLFLKYEQTKIGEVTWWTILASLSKTCSEEVQVIVVISKLKKRFEDVQ